MPFYHATSLLDVQCRESRTVRLANRCTLHTERICSHWLPRLKISVIYKQTLAFIQTLVIRMWFVTRRLRTTGLQVPQMICKLLTVGIKAVE